MVRRGAEIAPPARQVSFYSMGQAQPTLKEQIRENKRQINRAIREIDRERVALERQQGVSKLRGNALKTLPSGMLQRSP